MAVAAAIIAGGRGERLGRVNKALLEIGGMTVIARQLAVLRPLFDRIVVVTNDPAPWKPFGLPTVADRVPAGQGPLAGLDAALSALRPDETAVICVGADLPFLQASVINALRDEPPEHEAVVPRIGGWLEPLLARYGRSCAPLVERQLRTPNRKTTAFLSEVARIRIVEESELRALDPELRSFINVNTSVDLARARALASAGPS